MGAWPRLQNHDLVSALVQQRGALPGNISGAAKEKNFHERK